MTFSSCYWLGSAAVSVGSIYLFDSKLVPQEYGWRIPFLFSGVFSIFIIILRSFIPESPRWLVTKGRVSEAEAIVVMIEKKCLRSDDILDDLEQPVVIHTTKTTYLQTISVLVKHYRSRTFLAALLMLSQAFIFNAIFSSYTKILHHDFGVQSDQFGYYLIPFVSRISWDQL
ncbi:hypothetical protein GEMRC1_007483 [Eukaryota sp. GEM-RC1]